MLSNRLVVNLVLLLFQIIVGGMANAQTVTTPNSDSLKDVPAKSISKFEQFNEKAEKLFKIIPVPIFSYSSDGGTLVGLAKYNLVRLDKKDTISQPSKISLLANMTTKGRAKVVISSNFIWHQNLDMMFMDVLYNRQSQIIYGIGNNIDIKRFEHYAYQRFAVNPVYYRMLLKNTYMGLGVDYSNYFKLEYEHNGILSQPGIYGLNPGSNTGLIVSIINDSRDNRYNPYSGHYFNVKYENFPAFLGNENVFQSFFFDARDYFNIYKNQVLAVQFTTTINSGQVPFYQLAQLGGDARMRGYYEGALRDKVLVDMQVEYRVPVWSRFGFVTWLGAGRVAPSLGLLGINGFRPSYGVGLRIMVDSENKTNLRFDYGRGVRHVQGFYINFTEAF